ncbi:hypothetical protein C791_1268 [Amycolatopsis azurea DSM 43854]|uniref:Uncharacterized protein n=1 Tax=Amycolatopsis azurea DSM 43854 TaxID=1238180 RepID=M2NZX8_9PSEU|nr:hypothetical protein C791_1268 [Amycolatopsis azurea DSM 43854]
MAVRRRLRPDGIALTRSCPGIVREGLLFIKLSDVADPEGNKINFVWENPNYQPPSE